MAFWCPGDRDSLWQQIRAYLSERLPEYMLPSALTILDALPLTPTGKVDRLALPALVAVASQGGEYHPPRDEYEYRLVKIWENVLGVGPLGIQDNFFEIGGNSLLAARLIAKIEDEFGKRVEIASLLEAPTVEQARAWSKWTDEAHDWLLVALQSRGTRPSFYLVHGVGGSVAAPESGQPPGTGLPAIWAAISRPGRAVAYQQSHRANG
jgi:acyl carrier protein